MQTFNPCHAHASSSSPCSPHHAIFLLMSSHHTASKRQRRNQRRSWWNRCIRRSNIQPKSETATLWKSTLKWKQRQSWIHCQHSFLDSHVSCFIFHFSSSFFIGHVNFHDSFLFYSSASSFWPSCPILRAPANTGRSEKTTCWHKLMQQHSS